jgi:phosphoribosylglycinamide formyltransferase 1
LLNDKIRIAVLVSGGGTNLQALLDAGAAGRLPSGEIALVVADREDAFALKRAESNGIKTAVVCRKQKSGRDFEEELLQILSQEEIELIVLAGFLCILSEEFVRRYPDRIINVHPALIPSFCGKGFYGLKVHQAALDYGVKISGATVHFVNEVADGGRIIMQKAVDVLEGDTPESLQKRVMEEAEWIILPMAAEKVSADLLKSGRKK